MLDDWVRASPKLQLLWGVPGLKKERNSGEPATGSWAAKADRRGGAKAGLCVPI